MSVVSPIPAKWFPFLFLILFLSRSQAQQIPTHYGLRIDSLTHQGILLDKGWHWHAGDDPEWAKADFDDSTWESIDPTKDISTMDKLPQKGIGWLRIRLQIAPRLRGQKITMYVVQAGASEIFLNSNISLENGKISPQKQIEKVSFFQFLPSIRLSNDSIQVVAVRYVFSRARLISFPRSFFRMRLRDSATAETIIIGDKIELLIHILLFGVFLILGISQLLLYATSTSQLTNLYFGIFLVAQCILHFLVIIVTVPDLLPDSFAGTDIMLVVDFDQVMVLAFATFAGLFYLLGIYEYFKQPKGYLFFITVALILVTVPWFLIDSSNYTSYLISEYFLSAIVPWTEILRVGIIGIRHKKQGAKLFTYSHSFLLLTFILMGMAEFFPSISFLVKNGNYFFVLSFLSLGVSISLLLSQERSATNKLLRKQLIELESLSQKTIAQEQEKQQILSTQNETLEKQVTARTSELKHSLETLKATQTQLIQKEKLASLGELTAGIAHEIQNPLNFVNNFSEVSTELVDELKEGPFQKLPDSEKGYAEEILGDLTQNLQKITHHGKRASSIVKGMLEHSRTGTGERIPTDLNKLADEYLRLSYHGMRAKDKNFQADFELIADPNLPLANVVPQEIGRVLMNLLNNAFYAVGERFKKETENYRPKVKVATSQTADAVTIQVEDNGGGIPESMKVKIFQPFFTTKPTGEGTGLGLSLSYDIITKGHGGTLTMESVEGGGTAFIVKLPMQIL